MIIIIILSLLLIVQFYFLPLFKVARNPEKSLSCHPKPTLLPSINIIACRIYSITSYSEYFLCHVVGLNHEIRIVLLFTCECQGEPFKLIALVRLPRPHISCVTVFPLEVEL